MWETVELNAIKRCELEHFGTCVPLHTGGTTGDGL